MSVSNVPSSTPMNRILLAGMMIAGLGNAFPAQALHLSDTGEGQVLLFPYYTVNGGNQTLISVVNRTDRGKAVRLFFREGQNGRLASEVTLYLSPFDVWTGSVFSVEANSPAVIITDDNSCTNPHIKGNTSLPQVSNGRRYLPFNNAAYTGSNNDAGPDEVTRTREGYFELIELGEVTNATQNSLAHMTHHGAGVPANCNALRDAWKPSAPGTSPNNYWVGNPNIDMLPPGGGLSGSAFIVDALNGTMQGYTADAIDGFSGNILNTPPGTGSPTLADANAGGFNPLINAHVFIDGAAVTLNYSVPVQSIDAVSAVLMAESVSNEFVTSAEVGGASEWVVTFPTKRFYTEDGIAGPLPPFTSVFPRNGTIAGAAELFELSVWSRDGRRHECIPPWVLSSCNGGTPTPPPPAPIDLQWASNVIRFNQNSAQPPVDSILGSNLTLDVDPLDLTNGSNVDEGSARLRFWTADASSGLSLHQMRADAQGRRLRGLPVQGFWIARYTNGILVPGVLANYSDAVRHQTKTSIETNTP